MDFVRDYMRALLAKEIDAAAELQKQKSQVVYQQYCAGGTMHRGYYCPSLTEDLWLGNTKRGRLCKKRPRGRRFRKRGPRRRKDFLTYTALMRQSGLLLLSTCTAQRSISCTIQE